MANWHLKMISSLYCALLRVCVFCFVSCKTSQNVFTFCNYLHEVNSKFQNNSYYGCKAVQTLCFLLSHIRGRGGLMVSALDSRASAPGSSPGRGHCVVFLDKTLHSPSASLHPGVYIIMGTGNPAMD